MLVGLATVYGWGGANASYCATDPALRAQTSTVYVPGSTGVNDHVGAALQGCASVHCSPSNSQNSKVYGPCPPAAVAVHVTGVPAPTDAALGVKVVTVRTLGVVAVAAAP